MIDPEHVGADARADFMILTSYFPGSGGQNGLNKKVETLFPSVYLVDWERGVNMEFQNQTGVSCIQVCTVPTVQLPQPMPITSFGGMSV